MLDDMRKYVRAGIEALSSPGAEDKAGAVISRAAGLAEQFTAFASGFLEWSAEARASLLKEVKDLVARQVESMGLATREDVEALRVRLDRLESQGTVGQTPKSARRTRKAPARSRSKAAGRRRPRPAQE